MGLRTGRPRGRPKGAKNKRTEERLDAMQSAAAAIEEAIPDAFNGDAHAFLMATYKSPEQPINVRIDAAKSAIAYEKPKLAAVEHSGPDGGPIETVDVSKRDLARVVLGILREAGMEKSK